VHDDHQTLSASRKADSLPPTKATQFVKRMFANLYHQAPFLQHGRRIFNEVPFDTPGGRYDDRFIVTL